MRKILICGTRKKGYDNLVRAKLNSILPVYGIFEIIEGCCPDSADEYAEQWVIEGTVNSEKEIKVNHFPSNSGNYLKRNIEMVEQADKVIAFWDGFSYGTAHTIATAVSRGKKVEVVMLR